MPKRWSNRNAYNLLASERARVTASVFYCRNEKLEAVDLLRFLFCYEQRKSSVRVFLSTASVVA